MPLRDGIGGQLGPWTDFYALGAIAYRAVTGNAPPDSLRRLRSDPLVPAKEAAKGKYDPQLLATIDWMLQVDEAQRPSSVAEIYRMLDTPFEAASGDEAKSPPDFTVSESDGETLHFAFNASIGADKVDVAFMATPPGNYQHFLRFLNSAFDQPFMGCHPDGTPKSPCEMALRNSAYA